MKGTLRVFGHPLHAIMVVLPTAIFPILLVMDLLFYLDPQRAYWTAAFFLATLGAALSALSGLVGFFDYIRIPRGTRARFIGKIHITLGVMLMAAYSVSAVVRGPPFGTPQNFWWSVAADLVGSAMVGLQGYLGGSLMVKYHVGVIEKREGGDPVDERDGSAEPRTRKPHGHTRWFRRGRREHAPRLDRAQVRQTGPPREDARGKRGAAVKQLKK